MTTGQEQEQGDLGTDWRQLWEQSNAALQQANDRIEFLEYSGPPASVQKRRELQRALAAMTANYDTLSQVAEGLEAERVAITDELAPIDWVATTSVAKAVSNAIERRNQEVLVLDSRLIRAEAEIERLKLVEANYRELTKDRGQADA